MEIVYILTNEAMPGYIKIGRTAADLENRIRQLDTTGVPLPFECFYAAEVSDVNEVERRLHDAFLDTRVRSTREFFRIAPERVASALKLAEIRDVTPRYDIIETPEDQAVLNEARERRSVTTFSMLNIPVGAPLIFSKDRNLTALVGDNKKVLFEGESLSVSESALKILKRMGYTWPTVNGYALWEYEGESLSERRLRMEGE